jgi:uridine kinase
VIIDGLWVLRRPAVRRLLDLKIFVECPAATRLERRLQRDSASRGRTKASVRKQFRDTVDPMHRKYVSPQERFADLVLGEDKPPQVILALIRQIRALMDLGPGLSGKNKTFHF